LKVLWIIPGNGKGSSFIFSRRQVSKLKEMGVEGESYFLTSRTNPFELLRSRKEVKKIINELSPDIIHAQYGSINGLFAVCLKHPNTIISFQGSDLNSISSLGIIRNLIIQSASRIGLKRSICNIVVGEDLKKIVPLKYHYKSFVIPIGVDENLFKPIPQDRAREMLGWNLTDLVVLFNGNNPEVKRQDIALASITIVKQQFPSARLEILDGTIEPEKIPLLINASNVVLLCSDSEGSPTIIKEAMACNIPIVSNIVGDTKTRLENVNGALLTSQDPSDIANSIIHFFKNNDRSLYDLRDSFFSQNLSEKSLCEETLLIYNNILKKVLK
jgi:teichuronic acid biosynthesis glycosyltransferase TuaC